MKGRVFVAGHIRNGHFKDRRCNTLRRMEDIKKSLERSGYEAIIEVDVPYLDLGEETERIIENVNKEPDVVIGIMLLENKIWHLTNCHMLLLLPNWKDSYDCKVLHTVAQKLGILICIDIGEATSLDNEDELAGWFEKQI